MTSHQLRKKRQRCAITVSALAVIFLISNSASAAAFIFPSPTSILSKVPTLNKQRQMQRRNPKTVFSAESVATFSRGGSALVIERPPQQKVPTHPTPASSIERGGGQVAKSEEKHGASMAASIFNLVNNVAGAGILTLAAGKASGTGWIPAVAIVCFLGWASSSTFRLIAKACELTGEKDFKVCQSVCAKVL